MECDADIHDPLRMKCNNFIDPLTLHTILPHH